jgi:hypothetical protein
MKAIRAESRQRSVGEPPAPENSKEPFESGLRVQVSSARWSHELAEDSLPAKAVADGLLHLSCTDDEWSNSAKDQIADDQAGQTQNTLGIWGPANFSVKRVPTDGKAEYQQQPESRAGRATTRNGNGGSVGNNQHCFCPFASLSMSRGTLAVHGGGRLPLHDQTEARGADCVLALATGMSDPLGKCAAHRAKRDSGGRGDDSE